MELKELFESLSSVKDFDATKLDSNDIIELLRITGFNDKDLEDSISDAEDAGHFAYAGYTDHKAHKYVYAWFDDEDSGKWQVVALYIDISIRGNVQCDFGGVPIHEFDEEAEIDKFFKRVKRDKKV
jgi:hypothetical protein